VLEETLKLTEELVFLTPAVSYTLKAMILNCRDTDNSDRNTTDSKRDIHAQIQHIALNYYFKSERNIIWKHACCL
jgi:hypothetical protein